MFKHPFKKNLYIALADRWLTDLPKALPDIGAAFNAGFDPEVADGSLLKALDSLTAMNTSLGPRNILMLFAGVLVLYLGLFYGLEHFRNRKGGWSVEFESAAGTPPTVRISHAALGLSNVTLRLQGESTTNVMQRVTFDHVLRPVPFGRVLYEDLTFLPGVLTFDLFGHEVELVPRILMVDKREVPWQPGATVDLWPTNKPATPPQPPKARGR